MKSLTPNATYNATYSVSFPEDGTDTKSAVPLEVAQQDNMDRIAYLKAKTVELEGVNASQDVDIAAAQVDITAVESSITSINSSISTITTRTGDTAYTGNYLVPGTSHKVGLETLDAQLVTTTALATTADSTSATAATNIASIVLKLSDTALDGTNGMPFSGGSFVSSGDTAEEAILWVDKAAYTNRRINNSNYIRTLYLWEQIDGTSVGSVYDTLIDDSKIYYAMSSPTSTPGAYNEIKQEFGINTDSWVYYSIAVTIPSATSVMMDWNSTGSVSMYVTTSGSYTAIPSKNTWTAITAGTSLIVKIIGTTSSRIYNYSLLYK